MRADTRSSRTRSLASVRWASEAVQVVLPGQVAVRIAPPQPQGPGRGLLHRDRIVGLLGLGDQGEEPGGVQMTGVHGEPVTGRAEGQQAALGARGRSGSSTRRRLETYT